MFKKTLMTYSWIDKQQLRLRIGAEAHEGQETGQGDDRIVAHFPFIMAIKQVHSRARRQWSPGVVSCIIPSYAIVQKSFRAPVSTMTKNAEQWVPGSGRIMQPNRQGF